MTYRNEIDGRPTGVQDGDLPGCDLPGQRSPASIAWGRHPWKDKLSYYMIIRRCEIVSHMQKNLSAQGLLGKAASGPLWKKGRAGVARPFIPYACRYFWMQVSTVSLVHSSRPVKTGSSTFLPSIRSIITEGAL